MPAQKFARGLVLAFVMFAVCVAIRPAGLAANSGLSYYGSYKNVFVPYSLGFFVCAISYWTVAKLVDNKHSHLLSLAMRIMSTLFVGILITPHDVIDPLHKIIGTTLFVTQLSVAGWLVYKEPRDSVQLTLTGLLLISGIVAALNLAGNNGFLIQAQMAFQLLFSIILYRSLLKIQQEFKALV